MLIAEQISDYLRVTGYPGGDDWLFQPSHRPDAGFGMAGPDHVWSCDRGGRLELFDTRARRRSALLELGPLVPSVPHLPLTVSRDGQRLFVLHGVAPIESRLEIIDTAAGRIVATHEGLPGSMLRPPVERADGRLLLAQRHASIILVDPVSGARDESQLSGSAPLGFLSASPTGRYWIRFDQAWLPVRDTSPGMMGRLFGSRDVERRYGLTVQIWEAFPLRFLHRTVVAWLTAKELPNELSRMKNKPAPIPSRRILWDTIAAATAETAGAENGDAPSCSAYPPAVATDEAAWKVIGDTLATLARDAVRVAAWQADETAFWVDTNNFLSCVGLDNTVSPRLYSERQGLMPGTVRPIAVRYRALVPLAARKARVVYENGETIFDGAPDKTPDRTVAIPPGRDGWQPRGGPEDPEAHARAAAHRRVEELKANRREIVVPVAGWTEAEVLRAVNFLARLAGDGEIHRHAIDGYAAILFNVDGTIIPEAQFFPEAASRFPAVGPAIRHLIERFADASHGRTFVFQGSEGPGVLAHAVKVLGVLDRSALPTLKRYGLVVDAEHESFFAGETVLAVISAHGWTDDVIDFVFWVLVRNYYNTLQDYGRIWTSWGLRDAVVRREPHALARHLASELAPILEWTDDPGRYGSAGLEKLAREIPQPHEPWAAAFFEELDLIFGVS